MWLAHGHPDSPHGRMGIPTWVSQILVQLPGVERNIGSVLRRHFPFSRRERVSINCILEAFSHTVNNPVSATVCKWILSFHAAKSSCEVHWKLIESALLTMSESTLSTASMSEKVKWNHTVQKLLGKAFVNILGGFHLSIVKSYCTTEQKRGAWGRNLSEWFH